MSTSMSTGTFNFDKEVTASAQVLFPFAFKLTRNEEDSRDLIQETVYRSLLYKEKFQAGTNLKAWLYTIMRNIFINTYRRNAKRVVVTDETENQEQLNNRNYYVKNDGEANLVMQDIDNALNSISREMSVPFKLHYEGYRYEEIAVKMELPLGTVKSRIFFARKELQKKLERY